MAHDLAVAIIGQACRFPDADSPDDFWRNLINQKESIAEIGEDALVQAGVPPQVLRDPAYVRRRPQLTDVAGFDAELFGFSATEAAITDPQQRLFLECAWEALDRAAIDPARAPARIAVFAGCGLNTYLLRNLMNADGLERSVTEFQIAIANDKDFIATRASYKLGLTGPSINVNTACSTSLVAVHMAVQALLSWQCDVALAGAVSIQLPSDTGYLWQDGGISSPDGRCRPFDADGNGTNGGSGAGVVVLKRLGDALADNDPIIAVIRGSAVNNDGALKIGFTAPSVDGQAQVIADALAFADLTPNEIGYVEAHGTATALGDPIEVAALNAVFGSRTEPLPIGSVKGNVGHLDTAAGMAGLIKTAMALRHARIPATLHYRRPNPQAAFGPLAVVDRTLDWSGPKLAGVSSFGIGGTNAHVVLEQAPPRAPAPPARPWQVLTLSAKTTDALAQMQTRLDDAIAEQRPDLADAAFTLQTGRRVFGLRRAVPCTDLDSALAGLRSDGSAPCVTPMDPGGAVFLFPGQGSQRPGMARLLRTHDPAFRAAFERCAHHLGAKGIDLAGLVDGDATTLGATANAQPVLFSIEYALACAWAAWGVAPARMIGHSLGEWVAACLAGVAPLEDVLDIVTERGRLMGRMAPGTMLALALSEAEVEPWLSPEIALAAVNGPHQSVLAGPVDAMARLLAAMQAEGVEARPLATAHAFHSPMMDEAARAFEALLDTKHLSAPMIPFISNVTGTWITPEQATEPAYWARQIRATVRFGDGLATIFAAPGVLMEIGPGHTLASLAARHPERRDHHKVIAGLGDDEALGVATQQAQAWEAGLTLDWAEIHGPGRRKLTLPPYPFQRKRHWIAPSAMPAQAAGKPLGLYRAPVWKPKPLPTAVTEPRRWLIVSDTLGVATAAEAILRGQEHAVTVVPPPATREAMTALVQDCLPQVVLHLSNLTGPASSQADTHGLNQMIWLSKALGNARLHDPVRVICASDYMWSVGGEPHSAPTKALLTGPAVVMGQEVLNVAAVSVDFADIAPERAARILLAEAAAPISATFVAWRDGRRLTFEMDDVDLPPAHTPNPALRDGGTYLITGGLGGVGLEIAEALADQRKVNLVLTGRSGLSVAPAHPTGFDADAIDRQLQAIESQLAIKTVDAYDGLEARINAVCSGLLLDWLKAEGIDLGARHPISDLVRHLRILPKFVKFFDFILSGLEVDGHARLDKGWVQFLTLPERSGKDLNAELRAAYPGFAPMLELLEHCVDHYGPACAGDIEAISVLFPDGGEGLMLESAKKAVEYINARAYRVLAREVILERVRAKRGTTVRILEVGGGNGVATGVIAPALKGENVEYHFTDVGRSFVLAAEQNAKALGFDFFRFSTFDISRDPAPQGFEPGTFDIIIGLDVIHATPSIDRTIGLLKPLLKPGGAFVVLETVRSQRWDNMIGGLAEGWWYVEDDYRAGMPLMSADQWDHVFGTLEFDTHHVWPREPEKRARTDCALILAEVAGPKAAAQSDVRAARIEALEAKGAQVMIAATDVTDEAAMADLIAQAEARFGAIHGVVHAAMDMRSGSMQLKEEADIRAELAPKVAGTLVLDRLFTDRPLDFMVLCSSMSARAGGFGNAVYCGANAFIDAFAPLSNRRRPTLAIAWGRWQGVGFARAFEDWHQRMTGQSLDGGLTPEQGRDAFLRAIATDGIITLGVSAEGVTSEPAPLRPQAAPATVAAPSARQRRPALAQAFVAPETATERRVAQIWQEVLGIEPVGVHDGFTDLGGDSLIAIQVGARLRDALGLAVGVRLLFDHPTPRALAETIDALRAAVQTGPIDIGEHEEEGVL